MKTSREEERIADVSISELPLSALVFTPQPHQGRTSSPQSGRAATARMQSPRVAGAIARILVTVAIATSIASGVPRERRKFFTTCWGWGASCSMHSAVGRAFPPVARRPAPRPVPVFERTHAGIPSMVTSGTWEPGTMGKRARRLTSRQQNLLKLLNRVVDNSLYA